MRCGPVDCRGRSVLIFTGLKQDVTASMSESKNPWVQAGQVASIGMLILFATLIGMGIGYWLDGKLGTAPWLAFVFTLLGLAAGIYESAKILLGVIRDEDR